MLCEKYMVVRMDDNGNIFLVKENVTENDADKFISTFSGHKQIYYKLAYTPSTKNKVISMNHINR